MRRAGHVECKGRVDVHTALWWGNLKEIDYVEDLGIGGRIILKRILRKSIGTACIGLMWLWTGKSGGLL
jgi:hypothetical protein